MPNSQVNPAPAADAKVIEKVEYMKSGAMFSSDKNLVVDNVYCTHTHTMQKRIQVAGAQIYLTLEQRDELVYLLSEK